MGREREREKRNQMPTAIDQIVRERKNDRDQLN